jgi:hypothetical protein
MLNNPRQSSRPGEGTHRKPQSSELPHEGHLERVKVGIRILQSNTAVPGVLLMSEIRDTPSKSTSSPHQEFQTLAIAAGFQLKELTRQHRCGYEYNLLLVRTVVTSDPLSQFEPNNSHDQTGE